MIVIFGSRSAASLPASKLSAAEIGSVDQTALKDRGNSNPVKPWISTVLTLLKESFGQLWDYEREGWARGFFENWRASPKCQRLTPYEKFAEMIDRHWDGNAAY